MATKKKSAWRENLTVLKRKSEFGTNGSSKFLKIIGERGAKGATREVICNIARTRSLLKKNQDNTGLNWAFSIMVAKQLIRKQAFRNEKTDKMQVRGAPYVLTAAGKELYLKLKAA